MTSAVCLTFDLDAETAWISRDPANLHRLAVMSQGAYGPKVGVPLILDFLDRNGLRATFFVPGWTAERYPDVVAEIHRRGHEVGHHGYLHEALEGRSRDEEEEILVKTSGILESITGERPVGYRAPRYEITNETTGLLRKHGFVYASNLQDTLWPYLHPGTPPLVELPTTWILDDGPFFAYGIRPPLYRQIFPPAAVLSTWKDEFRGMYPLGGAYTLILHPQYIGRPSRMLMLQALVDYIQTFRGVWLTHGLELARWVASEASGAGTDGRPVLGSGRSVITSPREFVIPAGHARMWRMRAGERVTIAQTEGHQVGDLVAFNASDLTEFLSPSHTRRCFQSIRLTKGASLFTNRREPILELVEDTVGVHDILAPACDPYRYRRDFGVEDHRSCRMNFVEALAPFDIPAWRIPDPVNLFQHSPVLPDGRFLTAASPARPGDYVTLLARMDLVAACSACPQDLAPTNAGRVTDLTVRLS